MVRPVGAAILVSTVRRGRSGRRDVDSVALPGLPRGGRSVSGIAEMATQRAAVAMLKRKPRTAYRRWNGAVSMRTPPPTVHARRATCTCRHLAALDAPAAWLDRDRARARAARAPSPADRPEAPAHRL